MSGPTKCQRSIAGRLLRSAPRPMQIRITCVGSFPAPTHAVKDIRKIPSGHWELRPMPNQCKARLDFAYSEITILSNHGIGSSDVTRRASGFCYIRAVGTFREAEPSRFLSQTKSLGRMAPLQFSRPERENCSTAPAAARATIHGKPTPRSGIQAAGVVGLD
jgi:hypothetical protein